MNLPFVTDSHCHLDFPDFENNLEETIKKAFKLWCGPYGNYLH